MDHREASRRLIDVIDGNLDPDIHSEVSDHVARCESCRSWLGTYQDLALAVGAVTESESTHPDSETLAWYVVSPEEVHCEERSRIAEHLEWCGTCRRDVADIRGAIVGARPAMTDLRAPARRAGRTFRLAAAAAAVVAAVGLVTLMMRPGGPWSGVPDGAPTRTASAERASDDLSDVEIAGTRVIEGGDRVTLERVMISDGADVTIRAENTVAFGNGFRVGNRARLHVNAGAKVDPDGTPRNDKSIGRDS